MSHEFLIVEDHPLYREALESVLSAIADVRIDLAANFEHAKLLLLGKKQYDLVFLDLLLPDTRGLDGLIELRCRFSKQPIAMVSAFADCDVMQKAALCGAAGFIPKTSSKASIMRAVVDILRGHTSFPGQGHPPCKYRDHTAHVASALEFLTPQQLRVLQLMCAGLLNKQIAHELRVGETTVKAHVSEILRKMNVHTRTQAVLDLSNLESIALSAHLSCESNGCAEAVN